MVQKLVETLLNMQPDICNKIIDNLLDNLIIPLCQIICNERLYTTIMSYEI